MALAKAPYGGWKYHELDAAEQAQQQEARALLREALLKAGYGAQGADAVELELGKATLTLDWGDRHRRAYHDFADGRPFYHLQIAAKDKGALDAHPSVRAVFSLVSMGKCSLASARSLTWAQDFRGPVRDKAEQVAAHVMRAAPRA
jgi:hypothetical protein